MPHFRTLRIVAMLFVFGSVLGCNASGGSEVALANLTGKKLQAIKSPDSVVVKRIKTSMAAEESLSSFLPLTGVQLKELQALITNTDSFGWDFAKDCKVSPGVLVVFSKGSVKSEVRICFECITIGFTPGHWEDFDPVEQEMIDWAKSVFPNDEMIASLKPH